MGWLIALGILVLIAILPVGVSLRYSAQGFYLYLLFGLVKIKIFPAKSKEKKEKPAEEQQPEPKKAAVQKQPEKKDSGGKLTDFMPLVQIVLDFLGNFRRKLRVNRLELKLTMAADDPCDLAINYSRAWAAVGNLMPLLERIFVIKKRDVQVQCDFAASEPVIVARLDITITIGRIFGLGVKYGFLALRELLKISKLRKGGAKS
jgi:hypothetical protein